MADERAAPDIGGAEDESVAYFVAHQTEIEQRERHWTRRTLPRAILIGLLIVTLWLVPSAISAYRAQKQSDRVQSHGVRTHGYVTAVHNDTHSYISGGRWGGFRRSNWFRSMTTVQLPQNADTTTVYSPQRSTLSAGAPITVLLDPDDPSYAELPGQPLERGNGWVVVVLLACMVVAADMVIVAMLIRAVMRRRWRHAVPTSLP